MQDQLIQTRKKKLTAKLYLLTFKASNSAPIPPKVVFQLPGFSLQAIANKAAQKQANFYGIAIAPDELRPLFDKEKYE